jgi:GNAT superfamily N-acetyltransferase
VRRPRRRELPALAALCQAHARYERAAVPEAGLADRLARALFGRAPALRAWVAAGPRGLVGYASASPAFSTWRGCPVLILDCLYVTPACRRTGVGRALMAAVMDYAHAEQYPGLEWQTPAWNRRAQRFYRRLGARSRLKQRFALEADGLRTGARP